MTENPLRLNQRKGFWFSFSVFTLVSFAFHLVRSRFYSMICGETSFGISET